MGKNLELIHCDILPEDDSNVLRAFFDAEKFSVLAFAGNTPHEMLGQQYQSINTLVTIESLFGLVFIAFLAASLHRRISTRRD